MAILATTVGQYSCLVVPTRSNYCGSDSQTYTIYTVLEAFLSLWTRFEKRRVQEELEVLSSKLTRLRSHQEGSPPIERLQDDIKHYKAMIKCSVCHDRSKEVSTHLYAPLVSEICSYM